MNNKPLYFVFLPITAFVLGYVLVNFTELWTSSAVGTIISVIVATLAFTLILTEAIKKWK